MPKNYQKKKAFTLIELLIVIAIIAILAAAIFVAIDPARRLHQGRNARRSTAVATILKSVKKYQVDNDGELPGNLDVGGAGTNPLAAGDYVLIGAGTDNLACRDGSSDYTSAATLCTAADSPAAGSGVAGEDDCINFASGGNTALATNYLSGTPVDPGSSGTDDYSQYYISVDANGAVIVGSCDEEGEAAGGGGTAPTIEVSR